MIREFVRDTPHERARGHDPYRALAAAIVWRAVQDAFCGRKWTPNIGLCMGRYSCDACRDEAETWLLSDDGLCMAENAGLDAMAVKARLLEFVAAGLRLQSRRGGNPIWVTTR